jgi:DNA-binding beta-propeller fold protein YncE
VAISPVTGDVFIADSANARIVRLDAEGQFVQAFGVVGEGPGQLQEPADLAVEPTGMVLVLDALAQQLLRYSPEGELLATFGVEQAFYRPRGLDVSAAGQIAVADTGGARIVRLGPEGAALDQVGGRESELARGQPTDAALPLAGDLYVVEAESGVLTRLRADGTISRWQATLPANTIDGPHLAPRPAGGIYASDPEGRRVLAFDLEGNPRGQFGAEAGLRKPVGLAARAATAERDLVVVVDSQLCRVMAWQVPTTPPPR